MNSSASNYNEKISDNELNWLKDTSENKIILNYEKILEIDPNCEVAFRNKGTLLINMEKYEEAIDFLDKALEKFPNNHELLSRKGHALGVLCRYEEATKCIEDAMKIDPNCEVAFRNKGTLLINMEKYEEAIDFLDKALEKFPNNHELFFSKGYALEMTERTEKSVEYYIKAFEISTKDITKSYSLAFHLIHYLGRENISNYFNKALEKNPNDSFALIVKLLMGSEPKIEEIYRKYLKRNVDPEGMHYYQMQIMEGESIKWVEEKIKNSEESKIVNLKNELEPKIEEIYRKYLKRNVDPEGMHYYQMQIMEGESIKWVEEKIKNSEEASELN